MTHASRRAPACRWCPARAVGWTSSRQTPAAPYSPRRWIRATPRLADGRRLAADGRRPEHPCPRSRVPRTGWMCSSRAWTPACGRATWRPGGSMSARPAGAGSTGARLIGARLIGAGLASGWARAGDMAIGQAENTGDEPVAAGRQGGVDGEHQRLPRRGRASPTTVRSGTSFPTGRKGPGQFNDQAQRIARIGIVPGRQGGHVGAPGYYNGWVYVPVQNPNGVWKASTDFLRTQWFPLNLSGNILPWCSVNPLNGRLYTSMYDSPGSGVLFAFDRDTLARHPEATSRSVPARSPCRTCRARISPPRDACSSAPTNRTGCSASPL